MSADKAVNDRFVAKWKSVEAGFALAEIGGNLRECSRFAGAWR